MGESARASRLRLIVNKGREHGLRGDDPAEAYEQIEAAIWDGGALPADRPSQRRAWSTTLAMAMQAYDEGVSNTLSKLAIEAVSVTEDGAEPLKLVAKAAVSFASDQEIVGAVREALIDAGRSEDVLHFPYYFVREARAERVRSQAEIDGLATAAEREVRELAEYRAERDAQEIMASLPEGSNIADFQAAIRTSHPLISEAVAAMCAEQAARALSAQPLPAWRIDPTDPFGRLPDDEQDRKNQALHERAVSMLAHGETAKEEAALHLSANEILLGAVSRLRSAPDRTPTIERIEQAMRRAALGMENAQNDDPVPVNLWQHYETPQLPKGLLPPVLEAFAYSQADTMGADPAGLAMAGLAVCASAISDDISVQVKTHDPHWRESARLWVGLIGMPSTKKSPIMKAAERPLRRLDTQLAQTFSEANMRYLSAPAKDRDSASRPMQVRHMVQDTTIEALQDVLKDSPGGVFSVQDELSGWFGSMEKYNSGKGSAADRAFWLQAYNGGPYSLNRVARGVAVIPNLSVGLLGGIQPEPLRKIIGDLQDDGLIQRFLPVILTPATVGRDEPMGPATTDYETLVHRLSKMRPGRGTGNLSDPFPVRFSDAAQAVRRELEVENVAQIQALEGASPKLAAHYGKHDGIYARLCLTWHCIESEGISPEPDISEDVACRVAEFMRRYIRPSAIAFYSNLLGMAAGHEDLIALAAFIVSENLSEVAARDVQRASRSLRSYTADEARRLCERLESFGWLLPTEVRQKSSTPRWSVVPTVHELFAERGRQETDRRRAAKQALNEALGV